MLMVLLSKRSQCLELVTERWERVDGGRRIFLKKYVRIRKKR